MTESAGLRIFKRGILTALPVVLLRIRTVPGYSLKPFIQNSAIQRIPDDGNLVWENGQEPM